MLGDIMVKGPGRKSVKTETVVLVGSDELPVPDDCVPYDQAKPGDLLFHSPWTPTFNDEFHLGCLQDREMRLISQKGKHLVGLERLRQMIKNRNRSGERMDFRFLAKIWQEINGILKGVKHLDNIRVIQVEEDDLRAGHVRLWITDTDRFPNNTKIGLTLHDRSSKEFADPQDVQEFIRGSSE